MGFEEEMKKLGEGGIYTMADKESFKSELSGILIDELIAQYLPIVKTLYGKLKELEPYKDEITDYLITDKARSTEKLFKLYLDKGFSREEAMMLILDARISMRRYVQEYTRNFTEAVNGVLQNKK